IEKDISAGKVKKMPAENTVVRAEPIISADLTIREEQTASEPVKTEQVTPDKLPVLIAGLRLFDTGKLIDEIANPGLISYYEPFAGTASREQKTGLMAGLSGMVSRVDDNADPGTSMGVYIERKLSDRISVRPGIAFSYQGHNLSGNSTLKESMAYAAPLTDVSSVDVENNSAQLNLLAFEIPLDLVFTVWERRRSNVYLSAGASTMVYLNQKFDGSFTNTYIKENYNSVTGDVTYERNSSLLDVENNYGAFSHVDFMGLANFSAGFSMPLWNKNRMLFEPFVKVPLSDLTSLNLRIFYGGLSVKVRFLDR
ncbi:MAG TPA: outer membrane beta-barrel protein, partial [Bacteroidales bacterium]|nr:outer membrane beta-barrel protein [Bacteroidales bacterium]